ncbi:MAG: SAM-dependent DNA methyltransferase [Mesoflavibacter sp.]|nr:SAM-dependent DNA methyltransferase [Mesoflavibacter sp.]|tara:strand:+ start:905 stop:2830 length:1926 start_codon:yes stop_codon:yes gene_type:complete
MTNFKDKLNLIWEVADLLRGDYKQSDYGKVILPLTVLRRLDCVLAPTKEQVLAFLPKVEKSSDKVKDATLNKIAKANFHNRSKYDFEALIAEPNNVAANLRHYINGYSSSAREIIEYFNFDDQIERMDDPKADILYEVIKAFSEIDLSDMTSMDMGYVFEDLIRRFAEQSNETAGEHFTPREVITLMVNLLINDDDKSLTTEGVVKTLYDPACGTGGMLSIGEQHFNNLTKDNAKLEVFGQEINPESYAICKSDMLIKGQNPSNIKFGNSFNVDGLKEETFDYMISNPPFGVDWKKAKKAILAEYEDQGYAGRFGAGLPRINDGSLLFLQHMISKMKAPTFNLNKSSGSRIAVVFNGSPLFTGQAGSGESNIRQWIIENDWLESIIALPDQLFYNTGISTYIWIINNHKSKNRKGKVQLINATGQKDEELVDDKTLECNRFWQRIPRSLGDKRKEIPEGEFNRGIDLICRLYGDFLQSSVKELPENEFVKIYPNEFFGYWRITIEQPAKDDNGDLIETSKKVTVYDDDGNPVVDEKGQAIRKSVKGYKPDKELRDSENVPFLRENKNGEFVPQTIEEYFSREVKSHLPDAWIDESKTKVGYEINFTKYFYEFKPVRPLNEIKSAILGLEESSFQLEQKVLD